MRRSRRKQGNNMSFIPQIAVICIAIGSVVIVAIIAATQILYERGYFDDNE